MKKIKNIIKKKKTEGQSEFIDKLASLKYASKKDSKLMSSIVSNALKRK